MRNHRHLYSEASPENNVTTHSRLARIGSLLCPFFGNKNIYFQKTDIGDYQCVLSRESFSGNGYHIHGVNVR